MYWIDLISMDFWFQFVTAMETRMEMLLLHVSSIKTKPQLTFFSIDLRLVWLLLLLLLIKAVVVDDVLFLSLSSMTMLFVGNCWKRHITYISIDFLSGYSERTSKCTNYFKTFLLSNETIHISRSSSIVNMDSTMTLIELSRYLSTLSRLSYIVLNHLNRNKKFFL